MFYIEKSVRPGLNAQYTDQESYLWIPAWSGKQSAKARVDVSTIYEAIAEFAKRTAKVRSGAYRLVSAAGGKNVTLASVNASDDDLFKRNVIFAVGFGSAADITLDVSPGAVVDGQIVGATRNSQAKVETAVDQIRNALAGIVTTHNLTTRFNSNGDSGGVWLKTTPVDCIYSNSDVGISFEGDSNTFAVSVSADYIADQSEATEHIQNNPAGTIEHYSKHESLADAIRKLTEVVRKPTAQERKLLVSTR